jgi:uncharacterized protein (UPF0264 family)
MGSEILNRATQNLRVGQYRKLTRLNNPMPRLLVSVRDAIEAEAALAGGADLIDIKDPSRGALGAADARVWREVIAKVAGRASVSAALGELRELRAYDERDFAGLAFVKAGLAGCRNSEWRDELDQLRRKLPRGTRLVAVAYADAALAAAPPVEEVLAAAIELDLPALLIDTFDKSRGDLFTALDECHLQNLIAAAHCHGIEVALAGSLSLASLDRALALSPDWVAVRGAACAAGRTSSVSTAQVRELRAALSAAPKSLAR